MPSSHGGGSSGGGSHSSGGGSHSSGGSGSRGPRVSRRAFSGGTYYDYYRPGGRYVGFYCQGPPRRQSIGSQLIVLVITILFFVFFFITILSSFSFPVKLGSDKVFPTDEYYKDDLGIVRSSESFTEPLKKFYKKTGVQPYVYTFPAEKFPSVYGQLSNDSLENYAYKIYVNKFADEGHFLIVYTQDESGELWYWCDMSGDDTSGVINQSFWNQFQKDMQRYLNMDILTAEEAIRTSFDEALGYALSWKGVVNYLPIPAMLLLMMALTIVPQITAIRNSRMINEYLGYEEMRSQDYHVDQINAEKYKVPWDDH